MSLGNNIKMYRKALKLTQKELASRIGLQASAMSKIERGETRNLKPEHIKKLCSMFSCTPSDLYGIETLQVSSSDPLTAEQRDLIALIPLLSEEEAKALLEIVRAMFGYKTIAKQTETL